MPTCSRCGQENPDGFRFCGACGEALEETARREMRKIVTVLFCDLCGSTALGEKIDAEALRATMRRYHELLRTILEHHGGTVEKFVGDAVMAVFGIPRAHEDDALRAVRAAAEIRAGVEQLGLKVKVGVNTGEVVVGEGEALVTGDAVNVAARLEQNAEPGQILIGAETNRLVRAAAKVEQLELELKGKTGTVLAYRLVHLDPEAPAFERRLDAPLVGRRPELRLLREAFDRTVTDGACQLFTVLGPAGVGKSRLAAEFLGEVDALVVRGRCLHYGEGITFWPLVEVLKELGERAEPTLARLVEGDAAAPEALFRDVRKLLEALARERPLIAVFDDIQWAEATFLDLLDHVADLSRDAPVLLLCLARPELFDERPGWGGGKLNAATVLLEHLSATECRELVAELGRDGLDEASINRIIEASEGNPLFLEEMVALAGESDEVAVPPTIQALLAERLDRLATEERAVIERAAVEGKAFHRGAVAELALPQLADAVDRHLVALVRKDLVRPAESLFAEDDAFRFRHQLLRDAAYESIPKSLRSELHERFARWLDLHDGLVEIDELVGYHLEQATRYRRELGDPDAGLEGRAGERLGAAGLRAAARIDLSGARSLLTRAVGLLPTTDPRRPELLAELGATLVELGEFGDAEGVLTEVIETAAADADRAAVLRARLKRVERRLYAEASTFEEGRAEVEAMLSALEELGDVRVLAEGYLLAAKTRLWLGGVSSAQEAYERALAYAERLGDRRVVAEVCGWLAWPFIVGPMPIEEGVRRVALLRDKFGDEPVAATWFDQVEAGLEALLGRADVAAGLLERSLAALEDLGMPFVAACGRSEIGYYLGRVAGRPEEVESWVRPGYETLREMGEMGMLSTRAAFLADAVCGQGRLDEAEALVRESETLAAPDDLMTQIAWRSVQAKVLSRRGQQDEAERLAREAVSLAEPTEFVVQLARALEDLGEVLERAGKAEEAAAAYARAAELYDRKGMASSAERLRELWPALAG